MDACGQGGSKIRFFVDVINGWLLIMLSNGYIVLQFKFPEKDVTTINRLDVIQIGLASILLSYHFNGSIYTWTK